MNFGYTLTYHRSGLKFLSKQNPQTQKRISLALQALKSIPPQGDIKKMAGSELFRLRVGTVRILFRVDEPSRTIFIEAIGNRGDVYKNI